MSGILCGRCGSMNEEAAVLCGNCGAGLLGRESSTSRVDRIINDSTPPRAAPTSPSSPRPAAVQPQPQPQPQWPNTPPAMPVQRAYAPAPVVSGCPYCHSPYPPMLMQKISAGGWIVFAILLLFCMPFCWIGLLLKDEYRVCVSCGIRRGW